MGIAGDIYSLGYFGYAYYVEALAQAVLVRDEIVDDCPLV